MDGSCAGACTLAAASCGGAQRPPAPWLQNRHQPGTGRSRRSRDRLSSVTSDTRRARHSVNTSPAEAARQAGAVQRVAGVCEVGQAGMACGMLARPPKLQGIRHPPDSMMAPSTCTLFTLKPASPTLQAHGGRAGRGVTAGRAAAKRRSLLGSRGNAPVDAGQPHVWGNEVAFKVGPSPCRRAAAQVAPLVAAGRRRRRQRSRVPCPGVPAAP